MSRGIPFQLIRKKELEQLRNNAGILVGQIETARGFIKAIESGNLSIEFNSSLANGEEDALANSLLSMRDQMKRIASDEKQRNWATEGLAKFVDILRTNNDDLNGLGQQIISNIVKYMSANQGSLYILNNAGTDEVHLELIACYAYDRKKHITKKIGLGEGLVGQCVLEKGSMYMTNLPSDYMKITSGLGEALPKNLLIVPLLLNENVYGAIELASFKHFEKHHRDFIEKLAESIASTISNVRVNEQTKQLLYESQTQAEQVRAQEEEMRQNMEELSATQEEMQRILREVEGKEAYVTQLLNVSKDAIYTVDKSFKLVSWNKSLAETLEKFGLRLEKGMNTLDWNPPSERARQEELYKRVLNGESFELTTSNESNGRTFYHLTIHAPLRDKAGEVFEAAIFSKDVTEMVNAQKNAERLMKEAQNQTEEVKAQEEELRQNMEELSTTQEEMQRILREVEGKEAYIRNLLNVSSDAIFTIDRSYKLMTWNQAFAQTLEKFGMKMEKGLDTLDWYPGELRQKQMDLFDRVFKGETFEDTAPSDQNGKLHYFSSVHAPLRNESDEIIEVAVFAKDITESVNAQMQSQRLMKEAQNQAEELKAQEEEMRQNMEELSATQDEMQRVINEVQEKESYLNALLNSAKDAIFTVDKDFTIISFNDGFSAGLTQLGITMEKGFKILDIFPDEKQKSEQRAIYERALTGEIFDITSEFNFGEVKSFYNSSYSPLRNEAGEIFAISVFGKDVTEIYSARMKAESLVKESQEKTEELKAQEEELRQNMEELSSTQEEMQRVMQELEVRNSYTTALLDASDDMIFTVDRDYKLVNWNKTFEVFAKRTGSTVVKGFNTLDWQQTAELREEQIKTYKRVFKGESFEKTTKADINEQAFTIKSTYKPLSNAKGEVFEIAMFTRMIADTNGSKRTDLKRAG